MAWTTLLSLLFCSLFPGGSSIGDEPLDLSMFLSLTTVDVPGAAADDSTSLRPLGRNRSGAHVIPGMPKVVAASPSAVVTPLSFGVAAVVCRCLLSWTMETTVLLRVAAMAADGHRRATAALFISSAVATDVQFLT